MEPPAAAPESQSARKQQCWECLRRRLVCDSSRPVCNKCLAARLVCPGYDDKKPLKWLAPGKVTSRTRRRGTPIHAGSAPSKETTNKTKRVSRTEQDGVEVIPRVELRTDTCAVIEAACYYNSFVYPDYALIQQLAPNPYVDLFPLAVIHFLPASLRHTLVCLALGHRIHQLPQSTGRDTLAKTWSRLYHHRGVAIRALREEIGEEGSRSSDATIASVLVFLCAELRQSTSNWRHHLEAAARLITLRGGLDQISRSALHMKPLLLYFLCVGVIGNTTSPSSDQITTTSHLGLIDLISELYANGLYPLLLCPQSLFLNIININHLRFQWTNSPYINEPTHSAADGLLKDINNFSPEQWAESHTTFREEWLILGSIYQSAVALYCILSLQSRCLLLSTPHLKAIKSAHSGRLFLLLKKALLSPQLKKCIMWPLVVAGVEAVNSSSAVRTFVEEQLSEMSRDLGTSLPLLAKAVLERFWASGKAGWDDCFDSPYSFIT